MPKVCQVTGRKSMRGRSYALRGIAKKKKGIGLKVTGIKSRRFLPNLMKKRFYLPEEKRFITLRVSTNAMRTIDKLGLSTVLRKVKRNAQKNLV